MMPVEDQNGQTLLHGFCSEGLTSIIVLMLPYCINKINKLEDKGNTALYLAVKNTADSNLVYAIYAF